MEARLKLNHNIKKNNMKILIVYLLLFNTVWTFKELWLMPYINTFEVTTSVFLNALIKILIWIVPVWLYIKFYLDSNPIHYLKMNNNIKRGLFWGISLSILLFLYFAFQVYFLNEESFNFKLSLNNYINGVLLVGVTEEIVFRGLILQELSKRFTFWKANTVTALLFLVVHYGIWIYEGVFFDFYSHIYVFLVGLIFGLVFKKTGSFWSVVILHSFHNLFVSIS
ncbi:membrane protease YdiL (CAAX protease family) [Lysinibacillus parviboronicapiens]|uniref:Membrane protease YdiL (CAAX protease family) n=1 Tax=Lysinibacillus parviboronicapiens TaxID=436516 RepID=A0ABV2PP80_9BACI